MYLIICTSKIVKIFDHGKTGKKDVLAVGCFDLVSKEYILLALPKDLLNGVLYQVVDKSVPFFVLSTGKRSVTVNKIDYQFKGKWTIGEIREFQEKYPLNSRQHIKKAREVKLQEQLELVRNLHPEFFV